VIGLVLVSHSAKLVEGLRDLVVQMEPDVPLAIAGGTDDGGLGTSLELVMTAIDTADDGDGAVILYDLGSAEMTADSAVEFLDDDVRSRCLVVDAPLVEGAIAAAAAAGGGANLGAVAAAAASAAAAAEEPGDSSGDANLNEGIELRLTNVGGLHARPAGKIARAVRNLEAEVRIEHAGTGDKASAASTLRLVSLGVPAGASIIVRAGGPDADQALATVRELVDDRFGEEAADL
jgi:PTS hybrid protein